MVECGLQDMCWSQKVRRRVVMMNKAFEYESKYKDGKLVERRWSVGPILVSGLVALVLGLAGKALVSPSWLFGVLRR
jgi:hypothetical protein